MMYPVSGDVIPDARTWSRSAFALSRTVGQSVTIEDSRLCFVRSDAVEEEGTNVPQDGAPLIT